MKNKKKTPKILITTFGCFPGWTLSKNLKWEKKTFTLLIVFFGRFKFFNVPFCIKPTFYTKEHRLELQALFDEGERLGRNDPDRREF